MGLTRTTDATVEPVTTAEVRTHLRIDHHHDDAYLDTLATAARHWAEDFTNRSFNTTTWKLTLDGFPSVIEVPRPPLIAVSSIAYVDTGGTTRTESASVYTVITDVEPGNIIEAYQQTWSSTRGTPTNDVTVTYTAGYGAAASDVPESIRQAILIMVATWYEHRESVVVGSTSNLVSDSARSLLWPHRVMQFAEGSA